MFYLFQTNEVTTFAYLFFSYINTYYISSLIDVTNIIRVFLLDVLCFGVFSQNFNKNFKTVCLFTFFLKFYSQTCVKLTTLHVM